MPRAFSSATASTLSLKERIRRLLPCRIRIHRIMSGRLQGARIVTSWHDYPGAILGRTERPLLDWFYRNVNLGETWIDVGAHYGYTAIALARIVGPPGRVFAFEPVLATAGCVAHARELNRLPQLTVVPFGLDSGSSVGVHQLPTVRGMADSTIRLNRSRQRIFAVSFDSLWPSLCETRSGLDGVKIDVQGMELEVLRGMQETLRCHRPVVIVELHAGVDRDEVLETLAACGYKHPGEPIEGGEDPSRPQYRDNCSYLFRPRQ